MKQEIKQVNQSLGESPRLGPLSGKQFAILAAVFCLVFGFLSLIFGVSIFWGLATATWASLTVAFLSGEKPHLFWSKIFPSVPKWTRGYAKYDAPHQKKKIGAKRVRVSRNQSKKLHPFEDWLDLTTLVKLHRDGYAIGAYLLGKNNQASGDELQLVFGFSCAGITPFQKSDEINEAIAQSLEVGFKEIPDGERFAFRWSSFCSDTDEKEYLGARLSNPISAESEFLDWAQLARVQQLARSRVRKTIKLNVYCTFTPRLEVGSSDNIELALAKFNSFFERRFQSKGNEMTKERLTKIFNRAINAAIRYQQILSNMGLEPQPKDCSQLWKELCQNVGAKQIEIPHTLVFDNSGLTEEFSHDKWCSEDKPIKAILQSESHATSVLLNNGVPYADRRWVCLPNPNGSKKYVGVMTLARKPEVFASTRSQLRFLWEIFSRDTVFDCEIITEISPADRGLMRASQQMIRDFQQIKSPNKIMIIIMRGKEKQPQAASPSPYS